MAAARHVYELFIRATPEQVWQGITDPSFTRQYFFGTDIESSFDAGSPHRYVMADGSDAVVGTIEVAEPPTKLVMTWSFQYAPELAVEAPSRVTWMLTPAGERVTKLVVEHGDLFKSPITWSHVEHGWVIVLDGLKTLLETGEPLPAVDMGELAPAEDPEGEWHRSAGIAANNGTWDWLGKPAAERTSDDDEAMTQSAYAAAYHWARAARRVPANDARAQWLLARVWAVRGNGELALHHADRCAAAVASAGLADFDLAYAHECRARALACLGRLDEARVELAAAATVPIADPEDKAIVDDDLAAEPWYGLAL
jgi:uncharacterized protein YndB with AHSA1/START domain